MTRTNSNSRVNKDKVTIENIIKAVESEFSNSEFANPFGDDYDDTKHEVIFNGLLHELVNSTRRMTCIDDVQCLCATLCKLIFLCENEMKEKNSSTASATTSRWKMLLLALVYKRYHSKAPEAKYEAIESQEIDGTTTTTNSSVAGQGERFIFYTALAYMFRYEIQKQKQRVVLQQPSPSISSSKSKQGAATNSASALQCLVRVAPHAGGTRDVCTIIEIGIRSMLSDFLDQYNKQMDLTGESISPSALIAKALKATVVQLEQEAEPKQQGPSASASSSLQEMLDLAAKTLDRDLEIIQQDEAQQKSQEAEDKEMPTSTIKKELPSTFNVFIPHNERGKIASSKKRKRNDTNMKKISNRNLVQSVGEVLVWSKTTSAMSNGAFASGYKGLLQSESKMSFSSFSSEPLSAESSSSSSQKNTKKNKQKDCLHRMQTVVRNIRKGLNSYSRQHGYMLGDQFALNADAITLPMIGRGKAGDLTNLTRLATKKEATRVLKMINMRYSADPTRVSPVESVGELIHSWITLDDKQDEDELKQLTLDIQQAKVRATIEKLRQMRNKKDQEDETSSLAKSSERPVVIAALDNSLPNQVASVLMAAAMNDWVIEDSSKVEIIQNYGQPTPEKADIHRSLFLGETLIHISSLHDTMKLLNNLIVGKISSGSEVSDDNGNDSSNISFGGVHAPSFATSDGVATTKCVINLIDRHVNDGDMLILFTSADLRLPNDTMATLTKRGCSIHCHDADSFGKRLNREGAKSGDITISLAWDTIDDLDLHVFMPSGEELSYMSKQSRCGLGMLDVDMNAGAPYSKEPVENVFFGNTEDLVQAPKGKYKVIVQNYSYHDKKNRGGAIPWKVLIEMNGEKTRYSGECKGSGVASNVTVCEFDYKGRTVPFPRELIETSAFGSANLVNLTASTGETLESLMQLMDSPKDLDELNRVRELVTTPEEEEEVQSRPLVSDYFLEVTNRDRLYMQLCKLPSRFHNMIEQTFNEGVTLAEKCGTQIAKIMMRDNIHISELEKLGYPDDVVGHVKDIMMRGSTPSA